MRHPLDPSQSIINIDHQQQQHYEQQKQQQQNSHQNSNPIYSSNTLRKSPNAQQQNTQQHSSSTLKRQPNNPTHDSIETIPSSNTIDSAMYERDKQIYKCSTMRPSGKYDSKNYPAKPSILNCPLPEIPKEYQDRDGRRSEESMPIPRTMQRTLKTAHTGKAIPIPKIIDKLPPIKSPPPVLSQQQQQQHQEESHQLESRSNVKTPSSTTTTNKGKSSIIETPIVESIQKLQSSPLVNTNNANTKTATTNNLSPNDESNYAVTEL